MTNRSFHTVATSGIHSKRLRATLVLLTAAAAIGFLVAVATTCEAAISCAAQASAPQEQQPDLEKAMKYHSALLQRPSPGYLYDRFYNTWLDISSSEELKQFLTDQADAPAASSADRLLLAFYYAKQGKDVKALQQFRLALESDPDNAATFYEMATVEARTLDFDSALENLSKAANAKPSPAEAIKIAQLRGKLLVRNREIEKAAKVWDKLIRDNPDDLGLMEDLIELQVAEGMFKQAEDLSDTLIAKTTDPFQKVIRTLRKCDILQRSDNQSKALEIYENTLAQVGMDTWVERNILGQIEQIFRRDDDLTGLHKHLAKLTQANGQRVAIRKTDAKILMELGRDDEAIKAFEQIVALTPGSRENREAFIALLITADQDDRAVKQLESLVAQHSNDAELQIRLAELCHKVSAPTKAKAALEKFISLSGNSEYSYLRVTRLFEKFNDLDGAKEAFKTALNKFQDSDSLKEAWADFLFRSDSKDQAIKVWQKLAQGTDRAGLVRLARVVSVRKMSNVALEMLLARYEDLKLDTIYLGQLCNEAITLKKFPEAVVWATERVRLSQTNSEIDSALPQAILIINAANQAEVVLQKLQTKKERAAAETCLLVEMLERSSRGDVAESILKTSFEASKAAEDVQAIQILARQRVRLARGRQDWTSAAMAARELLNLPGGRKSQNVKQLIELYVRAGEDKAALKWIAEWKRLSPGSVLPWLNEANLLERAEKTKEAIAVLRSATQLFPDDSDLAGQLAQKYLLDDQIENAQRIFWREYEESEELSEKLRWSERLARAAYGQGKIDQLVASFQARRINNPRSIEPLLSIAQAHRIAGDYEGRRAALIEATRLKKDDLALLLEVAALEETEGDWEEAIQTLERASLLDESNRVKRKIAQLYLEYGEVKKGLDQLLDIAGGENSSADDIEKISETIVESGEWEELLALLTPNVDRFPDNYRLGYLMAIANEELGNAEVAKHQFLELLQNDQEMANVNAGTSFQSPGNYGSLEKVYPPSAIDLLNILSETGTFAYSYRGNTGFGRQSFYQSSGLMLPGNLEKCHQLSLGHLCDIALDFPEAERDELRVQLERIGIKNVKLLMSGVTYFEAIQNPKALLDIDPDNETALAIAVFGGEISQETRLKAYEGFKETFPTLAFVAAAGLDPTKADNNARVSDSIVKLKAIEEPTPFLVDFIAQRFSSAITISRSGHSIARPLFKKNRDALNQLLQDWYPKLKKQPQLSNRVFMLLADSFQKDDSPQAID